MITLAELTAVGQTGKTHGLKGEINCEFNADFDIDACDYFVFDMDGIFVPFFIEDYRFKNDTIGLFSFEGIDTEEAARELWGKTIYVRRNLMEPLPNTTEFSADHFLGFTLKNEAGKVLGTITAIDQSTDNVLFELNDLLIPVAAVEVIAVDDATHTAVIALPEGLLEIND